MLKNLYIENIAVIEKADIDFEAGLQILTGETGAGKSIIIDSINAVLGQRTSKELIRAGCSKATVSALFENLSDDVLEALAENGFSADENGCLLIVRTLSLSGNGAVKINGATATVGVLKAIGRYLINIHGQHDNVGLLDPDNHYIYLDLMAENSTEKNEYYAEFKKLNSIRRELASIETDEDEKARRMELLEYQIKELSDAALCDGEYQEIKSKITVIDKFESTAKALGIAEGCVLGDDESDGALTLVKAALREVLSVKDAELDSTVRSLNDTAALLEDTVSALRLYLNENNFSADEAEKLRERLDLIHRLMLKYGGSEASAIKYLVDATAELETIKLSDERINELSNQLDRSTERLISLGERLTATRRRAAEGFSAAVTERLQALDMPKAVFKVDIKSGRYTKNGCDVVEFLIGTNVGEDIKPLHKIASGGELSRVMLSLKSVLAGREAVDTLVFDEIGSGVSGRSAGKVGALLAQVSKNQQVLCVTHLAQIAAFADRHLFIEKTTADGRTYTRVTELSYEKRIKEIARIMSGTDMTENLYNSAKELLDRSKN